MFAEVIGCSFNQCIYLGELNFLELTLKKINFCIHIHFCIQSITLYTVTPLVPLYQNGFNTFFESLPETLVKDHNVHPPTLHHLLGSLLIAKTEPRNAIQKYQEALLLDPSFFDAYEAIIRCYLMVRSDKEALTFARAAARHIKQPAQLHYVRKEGNIGVYVIIVCS